MGEEKGRKRKREGGGWEEQKEKWGERVEELKKEMEGLFGFYRELLARRPPLETPHPPPPSTMSLNGMVGILMEESELPLSELVPQIHHHLKELAASSSAPWAEGVVTAAVVKSAVLTVGQRVSYGLPDVNADPLEDCSSSSLWCWQTRDLKLLPTSLRASLKLRRTCRQKIHHRITAISELIKALQNSFSDHLQSSIVTKASVRLSKLLAEPEIRLLADNFLQNNSGIQSEADGEQALLIKQLEKNKKEVEREKKRAQLLHQKEMRQNEKEQKRLQEETEKEEKRREREESEAQKQLRKQQDEAEKERKRREKEDAETKKRLAVQKQASIMERFLKKTKSNPPYQDCHTSNKPSTSDPPNEQNQSMSDTTTVLMDCTLSSNESIVIDDIRKSHLSCWRQVGHSIRLNRKQHWSLRKKPKIELYKELKLMATRDLPWEEESAMEKSVSGFGDLSSDDRSWHSDADTSSSAVKKYKRKQLLQFDKSYRPAFYGIWPKKSCFVGPRHPFRKDPDLDYDVDSDEEWEEDEPGESLSDCDKDEEEEILEGSKTDDEESEDGFFVPDGYLSDNEGVQVDRLETDPAVEETRRSPDCTEELESKEFRALLVQQKCLNNLTDTALRKNHPLVISNLMHEKLPLLVTEDLTGTSKLDKICLQALSICAFPGLPVMCISADENLDEYEDASPLNGKASTSPVSTTMAIQDSDMPIVVSAIQSCPQSIGKVVESLQQKFPTVSKSQLRNTVRQISDYVDNRWQVKKEILGEVGLSTLAEKGSGRLQNISGFFSKRCLPPADEGTNLSEISPVPKLKCSNSDKGEQICSYSDL